MHNFSNIAPNRRFGGVKSKTAGFGFYPIAADGHMRSVIFLASLLLHPYSIENFSNNELLEKLQACFSNYGFSA